MSQLGWKWISIFEKALLPALLFIGAVIVIQRDFKDSIDFYVVIKGVIVPVLTGVYLISSRPAKFESLDLYSLLGLLFSFLGFYFFDPTDERISDFTTFVGLASIGFYLSFIIFSYISLGRNLSIIPSFRSVVAKGSFVFVRHPIYSGYLHLGLCYFLMFPTVKNFLVSLLISIGLWLRAWREEVVLRENPAYQIYASFRRNYFFSRQVSFPFLVLFLTVLITSLSDLSDSSKDTAVSVQFAFPVSSTKPYIYDDWGSVFIGNHIYPRLFEDRERGVESFVAKSFVLSCDDGRDLSPECKQILIHINFKSFEDCSRRKYSTHDIKEELLTILEKKPWILPQFYKCNDPDVDLCLKGPNLPEIARRLRNLYFRFGWSKSSISDSLIGAGPYCLKISRRNEELIDSGTLTLKDTNDRYLPTKILFFTSTDPNSDFNIAIYGTESLLRPPRINVTTSTPLGYYLTSNSRNRPDAFPWNQAESIDIIQSHFVQNQVTFREERIFDVFLPKGDAIFDTLHRSKSGRAFSLSLPDYLPDCRGLASKLNAYWNRSKMNSKAVCENTSRLIESITKFKNQNWDGFITPLSPGSTARDSISAQYFSSYSKEAYTGNTLRPERYFRRIGVGRSFATLDGSRYCNLRSNPLGLGDLFITDFESCK